MSDQSEAIRTCDELADRFANIKEEDVSKTPNGESDWSIIEEFVNKAREEASKHDQTTPEARELERKLKELEDMVAGNNSYDLSKKISRLCDEICEVIDKNDFDSVMHDFEATLVPKVVELAEKESVTLEEYQNLVKELEEFLHKAQDKVEAKE